MTATLFILNEAPYGSERAYNGLRLAGALAARDGQKVRVFLMADAVGCAKAGQRVPEGYYNVQVMLGKVLRAGAVGLCGNLHGRTRHGGGRDGGRREALHARAACGVDGRGRQGSGLLTARRVAGRGQDV